MVGHCSIRIMRGGDGTFEVDYFIDPCETTIPTTDGAQKRYHDKEGSGDDDDEYDVEAKKLKVFYD
jgi:hypothetical protein